MEKQNKNILAIECAGGSVSACLYSGEVVSQQYADIPYGHVKTLMPMIVSVINAAGLDRNDIDTIGVSTGPGFFTGLRIGLATAQGLNIGLGAPVLGVTTLESFAHQVNLKGVGLIIMETKRSDYYAQIFNGLNPVGEILVLEEDGIVALLPDVKTLTGSGVKRFLENNTVPDTIYIPQTFDFPTASSVAKAVVHNMALGNDMPSEPLYLRKPDVRMPKAK